MRWLVNYLRQIFCQHDWYIEEWRMKTDFRQGQKVYMRCKKCGYHTRHWKV